MAYWFAKSNVSWFRRQAENRLVEAKKLLPSQDKKETAAGFWARVEKAGLLEEALSLYDQFAKEWAEWVHLPRETKKMFAERIEREGRQAEVEEAREELMEEGFSLRVIHEKLVYCFQPLDESSTRPWETPNPWENGRLFRKKKDQKKLQSYYDDNYKDADDIERWRFNCAKWRRDERVALANARRRAPEVAKAEKERQAVTKAEAERQAAAKADSERKAAEEKKQQELREKEEAQMRKKKERNARRRELRNQRRERKELRHKVQLVANSMSNVKQRTPAINPQAGDSEII